MKKSIIISWIIILSLLLIFPTSSKPSNEFVNHLADMVYNDCKGNDIHINQPIIKRISTNETFSLLAWPYTISDVRVIVGLLGEVPYDSFEGPCNNKAMNIDLGWDGCGILTSQNNRLDINGDTYYWNGVKVDVPGNELYNVAGNNNTQVVTKGNENAVNIGNNNIANTGKIAQSLSKI